MEDNQNQADVTPAAADNAVQGGQLRLQKIYVKDMSFETPNSPSIFLEQVQTQPQIEFNIGSKSTTPAENMHEVVLHLTVTVKLEKKTAFLVEVHQAGLFSLSGFPKDQMAYLLGAYCPNILYPFARETVADIVARGGFPQLLLEPVNFDAIYAQQVQRAREQQSSAPAGNA